MRGRWKDKIRVRHRLFETTAAVKKCCAMLAMILFALASDAIVSANPGDDSKEAVRKIRAAWQARMTQIHSMDLTIETELVPIANVEDQPASNPGEERSANNSFSLPDSYEVPSKTRLRYYCENDKIAFYETDLRKAAKEEDVDTVPLFDLVVAFNGQQTARFTRRGSSPVPMGIVYPGKASTSHTRNYAPIVPVGLWRDTERTLRCIGWRLKRVQVVEGPQEINGRAATRLMFERGSHASRTYSRAFLDVDASSGSVPLRWTHLHGPVLLSTFDFEYREGDLGLVLQSWRYTSYPTSSQDEGWIRSARVTAATLNHNIDDINFEVEFPKDARVVKVEPTR